jgi:general secretion pathway protein D
MRPAATAALCLALTPFLAPPAAAQDITVQGDEYVLQFDEREGEKLIDFIDLAKNILVRPIKFNPQDVSTETIRIVGPQHVKQKQFYQYFQSVLKSYDYIVTEFGPEGSSFLQISKLTAGGAGGRGASGAGIKLQAPVVDILDIDAYEHDPGTLITTSMPLRYIDARNTMATISTLFDGNVEQARNVDNANNLVITGFGSHVWGIWQLMKLIDVPPFKPTPVIHKRKLRHASVDDIDEVLTDLLNAARGLRPGQQAAAQQPGTGVTIFEIEPRIIAEPYSNALLITGDEEMVARIEEWVDVLDVEVEPRGNTHVYRLKNTDATEVADVLTRVLEQERLAAQARAGGGGAAGGGTPGGSSLEVQASAVADRTSNSIIVTASERKYAEIVNIVREMDVRRPQVLIEAAIVETSTTLNETLTAGIAALNLGGEGGGAGFVSNFGTPTGLDDAGNVDILGELSPPAAGGQFALFSGGDVPIPLLIQAITTDTSNKVLSRPYLMTNDNQEATISTQEETSYATAVTTQTSTTQSFDSVEAGITLTISPTISAGNYLRLRVQIEVSNFGAVPTPGAPPDKTTREVETPVTLPDGHTAILGGLVNNTSTDSLSKVPFFGDLPLIGWLFRSSNDSTRERYLYVFITPHIIDTDFALLDEISEARKRDLARLGGDVRSLSADIVTVGDNPDSRLIKPGIVDVFALPSAALPQSGDQGAATVPITPPSPAAPAPAPPPGFDDVFGYDKDKDKDG